MFACYWLTSTCLCAQVKAIFVEKRGLDVLLDMLIDQVSRCLMLPYFIHFFVHCSLLDTRGGSVQLVGRCCDQDLDASLTQVSNRLILLPRADCGQPHAARGGQCGCGAGAQDQCHSTHRLPARTASKDSVPG